MSEQVLPTTPSTASSAAPTAPAIEVVLAAREIHKSFEVGDRTLEILHGVNLELHAGEVLALMGPSGAGKSTLLHILGLLDSPSSGEVMLEGQSAWKRSLHERAALRNKRIGFVFQFYHLLPELTALENVVLPAMIGESRSEFRRRRSEHFDTAREMLESFGLADRMTHTPPRLSGGERQRVALARALFLSPPILIADEPTGNLDSATGERVLELLFEEQAKRKLSLLLVTHDERVAQLAGRQVVMEDGTVCAAGIRAEPGRPAAR